MSKKDSLRDVKSLGPSKLVPYNPGESHKERHRRRLKVNLQHSEALKKWCDEHGWWFDIKNQNNHWIFIKKNNVFEWWPSTAKLVCNKKFNKAIHCHDYKKVIMVLGTIK